MKAIGKLANVPVSRDALISWPKHFEVEFFFFFDGRTPWS
jgi:hypothetical protein